MQDCVSSSNIILLESETQKLYNFAFPSFGENAFVNCCLNSHINRKQNSNFRIEVNNIHREITNLPVEREEKKKNGK